MKKQILFYTLSLILMISLMPQANSTIPEDSFDNVKIDQIEDEYIFDFEDNKIPNDPNLITFSEYNTYNSRGFIVVTVDHMGHFHILPITQSTFISQFEVFFCIF